jgi:exonuclease SbcC
MLVLKKLHMENFGIISGIKEIEYKQGINLILAQNGKGKTTSLNAILMLLIDDCEGSYPDYINLNHDNFNIWLEFSYANKNYKVSFELKKGKSQNTSKRILIDLDTGIEIANDSECTKYLKELLNADILKYALIARQGTKKKDMEDNIVSCSPADRRELFKAIRNLEYEKEVKDLYDPLLKTIEEELIENDKQDNFLTNFPYDIKEEVILPFTEESLIIYKDKQNNLTKEKNLVEENNKIYKSKEQDKETSATDLSEQQAKIKANHLSINQCQMEINYYDSADYLKDIEKIEVDIKAKDVFLSVLEQEHTEAVTEAETAYKDKLTDLTTEREEKQDKVSVIEVVKLKKFDDSQIEESTKKLVELDTKLDQILQTEKLLADGKCPTCKQDCTHALEQTELEKDSIVKDIKVYRVDLEELRKKKAEYETLVKNNDKAKEDKDKLLSEITELDHKIEKFTLNHQTKILSLTQDRDSKQARLFKEKTALETSLSAKKTAKESEVKLMLSKIDSYKENSKTVEATIEKLEKNIKTLTVWLEKNKSETFTGEDELKSVTEKIENFNKAIVRNEEIKKHNLSEAEKKKANEIKLSIVKEGRQAILKRKSQIEQAKEIMIKDFPNFVIDKTVYSIENRMNEFIDKVYYKSLDIELRSTKSSIILEYGKGTRKLPSHRLSGAESKLVQISFISYFNSLINLGCLITDEPTAAFDSEGRKNVFEAFINMGDIFKQLIVITHDKEMKDYLLSEGNANLIML